MTTKLQAGAKIAITQCLEVSQQDRVVIVTDTETLEIGKALQAQAQQITQNVLLLIIEDYTQRPATEIPQNMLDAIDDFQPTISIYAAQGHQGELAAFRKPLCDDILRGKHDCLHAHMISIDEQLMEDGMNADYNRIYRATRAVYEKAQKAQKIIVTCPHGTNITYDLSPNIKWISSDGKILKTALQNLPSGETFTCPENANGTVVAWVLGDSLTRYGILEHPLKVTIENGYITKVESENLELQKEFEDYINEYPNGNRVGELGLGTLVELDHFVGNLLQDEKYPGMHVAFGHPYPVETGADWDSASHIDIIAKDTTITLVTNGVEEVIMKDGVYIDEIMNA